MTSNSRLYLQPKQLFSEDPRLDPADGKALVVLQCYHAGAARHGRDSGDQFEAGERPARKTHELGGIEARLQVLQAVGDGMYFFAAFLSQRNSLASSILFDVVIRHLNDYVL